MNEDKINQAVATFAAVPEKYQAIFKEMGANFPDELVAQIQQNPKKAQELLGSNEQLLQATVSIFEQNKEDIMNAVSQKQQKLKQGGKIMYLINKFADGGVVKAKEGTRMSQRRAYRKAVKAAKASGTYNPEGLTIEETPIATPLVFEANPGPASSFISAPTVDETPWTPVTPAPINVPATGNPITDRELQRLAMKRQSSVDANGIPVRKAAAESTPVLFNTTGMSFSQAYGAARKAGLDVFEWNGRKFTAGAHRKNRSVKNDSSAPVVERTVLVPAPIPSQAPAVEEVLEASAPVSRVLKVRNAGGFKYVTDVDGNRWMRSNNGNIFAWKNNGYRIQRNPSPEIQALFTDPIAREEVARRQAARDASIQYMNDMQRRLPLLQRNGGVTPKYQIPAEPLPTVRERGTAPAIASSAVPDPNNLSGDNWSRYGQGWAQNRFRGSELTQYYVDADGNMVSRTIKDYDLPSKADTLYTDAQGLELRKNPTLVDKIIHAIMPSRQLQHSQEFMDSVDSKLAGFDPKAVNGREAKAQKKENGGSFPHFQWGQVGKYQTPAGSLPTYTAPVVNRPGWEYPIPKDKNVVEQEFSSGRRGITQNEQYRPKKGPVVRRSIHQWTYNWDNPEQVDTTYSVQKGKKWVELANDDPRVSEINSVFDASPHKTTSPEAGYYAAGGR